MLSQTHILDMNITSRRLMNKYILLCKSALASKILFSDQASVKYSLTSWKYRQTEHTYDTRGNVSSNPALKSNNNHFFACTQLPFSWVQAKPCLSWTIQGIQESLLLKEFWCPVFCVFMLFCCAANCWTSLSKVVFQLSGAPAFQTFACLRICTPILSNMASAHKHQHFRTLYKQLTSMLAYYPADEC